MPFCPSTPQSTAIVIVEKNKAGMSEGIAAIHNSYFGVFPAPLGIMSHVYSVANLQEARTLISFLKGWNNTYRMIGGSAAAGNVVAL
jgi:hypothetical protein